MCITAVSSGRRVWVTEPRRDSQTSEADVASRWLVDPRSVLTGGRGNPDLRRVRGNQILQTATQPDPRWVLVAPNTPGGQTILQFVLQLFTQKQATRSRKVGILFQTELHVGQLQHHVSEGDSWVQDR